eukprot:gene10183-2341_t
MSEASQSLDAPTQEERDKLRGWNDVPPAVFKPRHGLPRTRHRYIASSDNTTTSKTTEVKTRETCPPPPPRLVANLSPPAHEHKDANGKLPSNSETLCRANLLDVNPTIDHDAFAQSLYKQFHDWLEEHRDQIHKRLGPLMEKLKTNQLTSDVLSALNLFLKALQTGTRDEAEQLHTNLVLQFSVEIGSTCGLVLKKLIGWISTSNSDQA